MSARVGLCGPVHCMCTRVCAAATQPHRHSHPPTPLLPLNPACAACRLLQAEGHAVSVLHRSSPQVARDEALQCFKFGVTPVLVAAGLAAMLDLPDVEQVVLWELPPPGPRAAGEYVKRVSRAGGGTAGGVATVLFSEQDGAAGAAGWLVPALRASGQPVPEWLLAQAAAAAAAAAPAPGEQQAEQLPQPLQRGGSPEERRLRRTRGTQRLGAFLLGPAWAALDRDLAAPEAHQPQPPQEQQAEPTASS